MGDAAAAAPFQPGFFAIPQDHPAHTEVAQFYDQLKYTEKSLRHRERVLSRITSIIGQHLPDVHTELFGSTRTRTYLPDGDMDITLCITNISETRPRQSEGDVLMSLVYLLPPLVSEHPEVIKAEVKLVKCVIDKLQVDITIDQYGGLTTVRFLECVNERIGNDGLFFRTLLLVKAWACYESRILGANGGLLGSYALTVMLITTFQQCSRSVLAAAAPLDMLVRFVDYYSAFDFGTCAVSVLGAVPLVEVDLKSEVRAAVTAAVVIAVAGVNWEAPHDPVVLDHNFFRDCRKTFSVEDVKQTVLEAAATERAEAEAATAAAEAKKNEDTESAQSSPAAPPEDTPSDEDHRDVGTQCEGQNGTAPELDKVTTPPGDQEAAAPFPLSPPAAPPAVPTQQETDAQGVNITRLEPLLFPIRAYNIMDPLRQHNNLGRSISKGNGSRVQASFRKASVELQFLCQRGGVGAERRRPSYAEKQWLHKWLQHRRSESIEEVVYGANVPPIVGSGGFVECFFRNSLTAIEKRRIREDGHDTVPGQAELQKSPFAATLDPTAFQQQMDDATAKNFTKGTQTAKGTQQRTAAAAAAAAAASAATATTTTADKPWTNINPGFARATGMVPSGQQDMSMLAPQFSWWGKPTFDAAFDARRRGLPGAYSELEHGSAMHHHHMHHGGVGHHHHHHHHPHHHHHHHGMALHSQSRMPAMHGANVHHHHHHHHHHHPAHQLGPMGFMNHSMMHGHHQFPNQIPARPASTSAARRKEEPSEKRRANGAAKESTSSASSTNSNNTKAAKTPSANFTQIGLG